MVLVPQSDDDGREYTYFWSKKNIFYRYDFFLFSKPMLPFLSGAAAVWKRGGDASDHPCTSIWTSPKTNACVF